MTINAVGGERSAIRVLAEIALCRVCRAGHAVLQLNSSAADVIEMPAPAQAHPSDVGAWSSLPRRRLNVAAHRSSTVSAVLPLG
jgi:hypothetical protein